MSKKIEAQKRRKHFSGVAVCSVLACTLLFASAQSARAQGVLVNDVITETALTSPASPLLLALSSGFSSLATGLGVTLPSTVGKMMEQNSANERYNLNVDKAQTVAMKNYEPTTSSSTVSALAINHCAQVTSGTLLSTNEQDTTLLGTSLASANYYDQTTTDTSAASAEQAARCKLGDLPVDSSASGKANKLLGCSDPLSGQNARAARTMSAVIGPLQYLVPPNMVTPTTAPGGYKPFGDNPPTDKLYYPILAAQGFCQYITPTSSSIPVSDKANVGTLAVLNEGRRQALSSAGPDTCWAFFAERLQVPSNVTDTALQAIYTEQAQLCMVHNESHIINDAALADCKTNGRSTLKAQYDVAHRLTPDYKDTYLVTVDANTRALIMEQLFDAPERFTQRLMQERQMLERAVSSTQSGSSGGSRVNSVSVTQ